jgi:hypothetical protein
MSANPSTLFEPFVLSMLGGTPERRFNRMRDKLDLSWGALADAEIPHTLREEARETWTRITYVEYRSASSMSAVAEALIAARAPLDLSGLASSFAYDELSHAEMCARVVGELGGPTPLLHQPQDLVYKRPSIRLRPLLRAADIVVRVFCVAEAFALPMAQIAAKAAEKVPLIHEVLRRIAKDEASHAGFGWIFMDWVAPLLSARDRAYIAKAAQASIDAYRDIVENRPDHDGATLGWLSDRDFKTNGRRTLEMDVVKPLRARDINVH